MGFQHDKQNYNKKHSGNKELLNQYANKEKQTYVPKH